MFKTLSKRAVVKAVAFSVVPSSLLLSAAAHAQTASLDVSEATDKLGSIDGALVAVGGVIIGLAAVAVGFKWIKGMIFS